MNLELFEAVKMAMKAVPHSDEPYFALGECCMDDNVNQAYLCYEQAAYLGRRQGRDVSEYEQRMEQCRQSDGFSVRNCSVVILSYNIKDVLEQCIESIRRTTPREAYEIVVADNASTDGAAEWLKQQDDLTVYLSDTNLGFSGGCNAGIRVADRENDILLLNNDTLIPDNSFFWMRMGLYARESIGAAGPMSNRVGNHQIIFKDYHTVGEWFEFADTMQQPDLNAYENKVMLIGFAELIKREAFNEVGLLDTRFGKGNYEDDDYGIRLSKAGYELVLCHNAFIFHYGSLSIGKDAAEYAALMAQNKQKLTDKWGFSLSYYTSLRGNVLDHIAEEPGTPIKVLEVGCGCGTTLSHLKWKFPGSEVKGIELMEEPAALGRYMADIMVGNIEEMEELPYEEEHFDYIIILDVLEHLRRPDLALKKIKRYLKPAGKVIVSVPNLLHYSVILPLLEGRFEYRDEGLLDRTHIHFFTLLEAIKMLYGCGFEPCDANRVMVDHDDEGIENVEERIDALAALSGSVDKDEFYTYQIFISARKKS